MNKKIKCGVLSTLLLVAYTVGCTPKDKNDYTDYTNFEYRHAKGTTGAVTCANNLVSKIGLDTLIAGGNAYDAAVAMSFGLGLLEPNASGMGGGGVMTGYNVKTGDYVFYNFREFAPGNISYDLFTEENHEKEMTIGGLASAVPMQVSGLLDIFDDLGSKALTLEQIMKPTLDYCDNGYDVTPRLSENILWTNIVDNASAEAQDLYGSYNSKLEKYTRKKRAGEQVKNENLGKVLREIIKSGKDGFYSGWVAEAITTSNQEAGGVISLDDLTRAKTAVVKTTPLHSTYKDYDIYTSKNPAAGGVVIAETLNMLEAYCNEHNTTLKDIGFGTSEYIHLYSTASQLAYADKRYYIGDNAINPATNKPFISVPTDGLISKDYAAKRISVFNPEKAFIADLNHDFGGANGADPWAYDNVNKDRQEYLYPAQQNDFGTTSLSVIDKDGNICTITQTINTYWGSYVMPAGTGFFLNNQMADFTYDPLSVNRIEPYKSPISSMAPTIIAKDGKNVMTVGCPGSGTIPNAITQVILGVLDFDMDIQEAIEARRVECTQSDTHDADIMFGSEFNNTQKKVLTMDEAGEWGDEVKSDLEAKDYYLNISGAVTHVYGITMEYNKKGEVKEYMAGADNRKDGKSLAY